MNESEKKNSSFKCVSATFDRRIIIWPEVDMVPAYSNIRSEQQLKIHAKDSNKYDTNETHPEKLL